MKYKIFQVDAFSNTIFGGNPACVVPLSEWLLDDVLLSIARENAVAETAFFINNGKNIHLRWFTPDLEIDLCGHATLATAHVLKSELDYESDKIKFDTLSGELIVTCENDFYYLDFPSRKPKSSLLPKDIKLSLNIQPQEVYKSRDFLLVYNNQQEINDIEINKFFFDKINLGCGGVIVTARGDTVDFVSRFFTPQATILEDPVTGSAHCSLIPYWSERLSKLELKAIQLSKRGGNLICEDKVDRVIIGGQAKIYFKGEFNV
tara:strand:+ start:37 stop:822 length:786 start_codon:yes stop_codon:yes gene_type:complete